MSTKWNLKSVTLLCYMYGSVVSKTFEENNKLIMTKKCFNQIILAFDVTYSIMYLKWLVYTHFLPHLIHMYPFVVTLQNLDGCRFKIPILKGILSSLKNVLFIYLRDLQFRFTIVALASSIKCNLYFTCVRRCYVSYCVISSFKKGWYTLKL